MAPFVLPASQVSTRYLFFPSCCFPPPPPPIDILWGKSFICCLPLKFSFSSACLTYLLFCCHLSGCPSISASLSQIFLVPTCPQLYAAHLSCCDVMWCGVGFTVSRHVMRCDVIWCDMLCYDEIWCDKVWWLCCYVMWCVIGVIWWDVMRYGVIKCNVVWCDVMWYDGMMWCDLMWWCDVMWYDVVWCGVM